MKKNLIINKNLPGWANCNNKEITIDGHRNLIPIDDNDASQFKGNVPLYRKVDSREKANIQNGILDLTCFALFKSDSDLFAKNHDDSLSSLHCSFSTLEPKELDKVVNPGGDGYFFRFDGKIADDLIDKHECANFYDKYGQFIYSLPFIGANPKNNPTLGGLFVDSSIRYIDYENEKSRANGLDYRDKGHLNISDLGTFANRAELGMQRKAIYAKQREVELVIFITSTKPIVIQAPTFATLSLSSNKHFYLVTK